jgi:hypothetical protein
MRKDHPGIIYYHERYFTCLPEDPISRSGPPLGSRYCIGDGGESDGDDGFGEYVGNWDSCGYVETERPKLAIAGCARLA